MAPESSQLDDADLEVAFHSALALMGFANLYTIRVKFRPFSSIKSNAELGRSSREISAEVSDAYRLATREVLLGLALDLCGRLLGRRVENEYTKQYWEFSKKGSVYRLSDSLRLLRGRKRAANHAGAFFDLLEVGKGVFMKYSAVLGLEKMPEVFWNGRGGRRTLAFYDRAFDSVLVSRIFDSPKVPPHVVEYLLFHEFLHAKHGPLYERGKSKRVIVHSHAFRRDERKFERYAEADSWLARNVGRLD